MEFTEFGQLIGSYGFPIVMCFLMFKQMNKQNEQHQEEMEKITAALNNNTIAIERLTALTETNE